MRPSRACVWTIAAFVTILAGGIGTAVPALAQITTATVSGAVKDASNAVIPGATVTLTSATRGTSEDTVTSTEGDFVFPAVQADTYTVKVVLTGFKTIERPGVVVHAGDKIALGNFTIEVGALEETITVAGESPLVQTRSGERAFAITTESIQAIAQNGRNFNTFTTLAPGFVAGTVNGLRANQNTTQIDGVTSMDTGNNGSAVTLTLDAVQEVKVLTTSYQAEYGRSAGAQISAVTKSGGNTFHGSAYVDRRKDDLNANTWINNKNGLPKAKVNQSDEGYTFGGPIIKSKLFFFGNQEFQQRLNANTLMRVRVPTDLERAGDFSQTRDNSGNLFNLIRDYRTGLPCTAADSRGCFQDGGVLGRIPASRLYDVGLNVLKMYPGANSSETIGQGYNYVTQQSTEAPRRQDLIRLDWMATSNWRVNGKYLHTGGGGWNPYGGGTTGFATNIPAFGSVGACPCTRQITMSADATLNNETVMEITWGTSYRPIMNYAHTPEALQKASLGLSNFPLLYPSAVQRDYVPSFTYGGRVGTFSPTNSTQYAPFENFNTTHDVNASITRLFGRHTGKAGLFVNHALKSQSSRAFANGLVSFQNDASNPFDSGYPFANAALGIYQTFSQAGQWVKGNYVYNNVEWYAQDNWRVTDNLTLDYGIRFYWLEPTYDTRLQTSNFLPGSFDPSKAARLYYPAVDPATNTKVALDRATGAMVPAVNIGRIVPGSGTLVGNGLYQAGNGIDEHLYLNRGVHYAPRFGFAYDVTGVQHFVVRGGAGVFYDRAAGDTVYAMIEQPPTVAAPNLFYGRLQDITGTGGTLAPPTVAAFDYEGRIPTVYAVNMGVQMQLPWSSAIDISYVGSKSRNLNTQVNINAPAYGAAYRPENRDPTVGACPTANGCAAVSTVPGANALPVDFLRPYQGFGDIIQIQPTSYANYNSLQTSWNRRFTKGLSFGVNYVLGRALGTSSTDFPAGNNTFNPLVIGMPRTDGEENQRKANYMPLSTDRRHTLVGNFIWELPKTGKGGAVAAVADGWQLSGVYRAGSGTPYTITYSIPGTSVYTLTGTTRLESARVVINGNPGSGHSSDPYQQFNASAFTTPGINSLGLESGTNYFTQAPQNVLDLSISRIIPIAGTRRLEVRIDAFNALNSVNFTTVNNTLQVRSLTDPTPTNLAEDAAGNVINPTGFGAVTAVAPAREVQLLLRFQF
jgi:Carboxypeptidase regulatory-like domain